MSTPPVTEIAYLPLKPGANVEESSSPEGKIWKEQLGVVLGQPGCIQGFWGLQIENPSIVRLLLDWETRAAHQTFIDSAAYGPFVQALLSIMDGAPDLHHVPFQPFPPNAVRTAPTTEVFTMYFESDITQADQDAHTKNVGHLLKAIGSAEGCHGAAVGWAMEDRPHSAAKGDKGKAYVALIGWDSLDAHMKFRETDAFKENRHFVRDVPGVGVDVYHVNFKGPDSSLA